MVPAHANQSGASAKKPHISPLRSLDRAEQRFLCADTCERSDRHLCFSRSVYSVLPHLVACAVLSYYAVTLSRQFPATIFDFQFSLLGKPFVVSMPLLGLVVAVAISRPIALLYNERYEIRCHHVLSVSGIFSTNTQGIKLPYETLLGVHVRQSLWHRIFNIGTILVGTALTDMPEVRMYGVPRPYYYAEKLSERIDEALKEREAKVVHQS